jgi:serine/threonine protein phosphatase PrpC
VLKWSIVELAWGPVVLGMSLVLLAWMAVGRRRSKPRASVAPVGKSRPTTASQTAAKVAVKTGGPAPTAPAEAMFRQTPADDEDITMLRAIPVSDRAGDLSVPELPGLKLKDAEEEEERASHIQLIYETDAEAEEVTAASARILLYAAGDSDRGRVRQRNEDSLLLMPECSLFAVADGMGGHRGGEVASRIAIDTLADAFHRATFEGHVQADRAAPRRARELAAAVQMTNDCVRSKALTDRELTGMGTTLVAAHFSPNKQRLYVGHVGDSRCYRLRAEKLRQLTTDHTLASLGMHGARAKDLYQAVGVSAGIAIDVIVDKPQDDDVYLLCSDGVSKMLSDDKIREVLVEQEDLESALYTLLEAVNDRGATDNVTAIIVKVVARTSKQAPPSPGPLPTARA